MANQEGRVIELLERLFADRLILPPADEPLDPGKLPARGGVYALTDEAGRLIQTLGTESLRRSVLARLRPPRQGGSRRRADLRSIARTLWWQRTFSAFETSYVFLNIARQLLGPDYRKQLAFGPVWFARMELGAALPRWTADRFAFGSGATAAGPFVTRQKCAQFIKLLEDLFDLCRHHHVLEQVPDGQACAYFEMGKCPAPCNGSISLEAYRDLLCASVRFATGDGQELTNRLGAEMAIAAENLQFERAQQFKEKLEQAAAALTHAGRLARSPDDFRYLVVQAGARASTVRPFFVKRGKIDVGQDAHLQSIDQAAAAWSRRMLQSDKGSHISNTYRSECIWLVSHFVAKGDQAPGAYLGAPQFRDPAELAERVRAKFARPRADNNPV